MLSVGQIVYSKCGRDKGRLFVVVDVCSGYCFIADGNLRKLENPKKKKLKHIQLTNNISELVNEGTLKNLNNSDIRSALLNFDKP